MKVRREVVQMPFWGEKSGFGHGGVELEERQYVESPNPDFSFQNEQMCGRSRSFMNSPG